MAQKVVVELIDDLDGTPIPSGKGETIDFAVDGVSYSIDLGPKNAKGIPQIPPLRKPSDWAAPRPVRDPAIR